MSFRYIGSKARIVEAIIDHVGAPDGGVFVDGFSGQEQLPKQRPALAGPFTLTIIWLPRPLCPTRA